MNLFIFEQIEPTIALKRAYYGILFSRLAFCYLRVPQMQIFFLEHKCDLETSDSGILRLGLKIVGLCFPWPKPLISPNLPPHLGQQYHTSRTGQWLIGSGILEGGYTSKLISYSTS